MQGTWRLSGCVHTDFVHVDYMIHFFAPHVGVYSLTNPEIYQHLLPTNGILASLPTKATFCLVCHSTILCKKAEHHHTSDQSGSLCPGLHPSGQDNLQDIKAIVDDKEPSQPTPSGLSDTMSHGELDPLVSQYQYESHRRRAPEALKALQKIASIVKPIMRQRNWRVGTLCEFYPPEHDLLGLNINRGEKICLRLRHPGDEDQFLPLEQVVDTMLHELCHIVHGPHDQQFHALWNQLRDEHEALVRKGYTGEGFLGRGERLGGSRIPMHEARRRARLAAEKRRTLAAGGGQRLGGTPVVRGADMRKVIADAAQRRITVERGCASGTDKGLEIAKEVDSKREGVLLTKADEDDANEAAIMQAYIELIQEEERQKYGEGYIPPSETNPAGMRSTTNPPVSPKTLRAQQAAIEEALLHNNLPPALPTDTRLVDDIQPAASTTTDEASAPDNELDTWTCDICTLVNPIDFLVCDACGMERPLSYSPPLLPPRPSESTRPAPYPSQQPPRNPSRLVTNSSTNNKRPHGNNALKPRLNAAEALAKFKEQEACKKWKPMGWTCLHCGNWMEQEWWTCAACGRMRASS